MVIAKKKHARQTQTVKTWNSQVKQAETLRPTAIYSLYLYPTLFFFRWAAAFLPWQPVRLCSFAPPDNSWIRDCFGDFISEASPESSGGDSAPLRRACPPIPTAEKAWNPGPEQHFESHGSLTF